MRHFLRQGSRAPVRLSGHLAFTTRRSCAGRWRRTFSQAADRFLSVRHIPLKPPPLFDPPEARSKGRDPFVPTSSAGRGAQEGSRDETACGARDGARPLTALSTVASPSFSLYAGIGLASNVSPRDRTAQAIRANLLAKATMATFL